MAPVSLGAAGKDQPLGLKASHGFQKCSPKQQYRGCLLVFFSGYHGLGGACQRAGRHSNCLEREGRLQGGKEKVILVFLVLQREVEVRDFSKVWLFLTRQEGILQTSGRVCKRGG